MRFRVILAIAFVALEATAGGPKAHVTCVGDSITFGLGASKPYPMQLQGLLGAGYAVENDGRSGATMLRSGDRPYPSFPQYAASTTWASAGGEVVIMLGTNDSKSHNWAHKASFEGDCEALVEHYRTLPGKPRVWVSLPPPASANPFAIDNEVITKEIIPALRQCAANKGATVIDATAAFAGQMAHLPDGVHPDDIGAELIAKAVRDALIRAKP